MNDTETKQQLQLLLKNNFKQFEDLLIELLILLGNNWITVYNSLLKIISLDSVNNFNEVIKTIDTLPIDSVRKTNTINIVESLYTLIKNSDVNHRPYNVFDYALMSSLEVYSTNEPLDFNLIR
jgi:hypothetical protein